MAQLYQAATEITELMMHYQRTILIIAIFLIVFVLRYVVVNSGVLNDIDIAENTIAANKNCTSIAISPGAEDIVVDKVSGILFVSAYDRRLGKNAQNNTNGIYAFQPGKPQGMRLVSTDAPADFQPHGISFWSDGVHRQLFAVSHRSDGREVVEIFDVTEGGDLAHKETVMFAAMHSPNDIQAVGQKAFYVTNDKGAKGGALSIIFSYLGMSQSSVAFYDGDVGRTVAEDLSFANGINISADGRFVYVAESLPRSLRVYTRSPDTNELSPVKDIPLNSAPDNIDVDEDGQLWIGAHHNLFRYVAYKKDPTKLAPSHVLKVNPQSGEITDIYYDDGENYRASTVAVSYGAHYFVGSVYEDRTLMCSLPENQPLPH